MIGTFFTVLFGMIVLFPFLITFLILIIYKRKGRAPVSVLGQAADLTTPFLFLSVYFVALTIFGTGVGFYIVVGSILIIIAYAIYERVNVKDFRIFRLLRKTWRLYFLVLASVYILLLIAGVIAEVVVYAQ